MNIVSLVLASTIYLSHGCVRNMRRHSLSLVASSLKTEQPAHISNLDIFNRKILSTSDQEQRQKVGVLMQQPQCFQAYSQCKVEPH